MGRRIVWRSYESSGTAKAEASLDGYFDKLIKYIPSDVVGLWLAGSGVIESQAEGTQKLGLLWFLFVIGLVFSFLWTKKLTSEAQKEQEKADGSIETKKVKLPVPWRQVFLSCGSFFVWVFALGGPFKEMSFYDPLYGSLLLLVYTSGIPFLPAPNDK